MTELGLISKDRSGYRPKGTGGSCMKKTAATGAILATAVAVMFMANPSFAQGTTSSSSQPAKVKCTGANDCKGKSACKTATSPGPGQNSCKGQGLTMTSTEQECKDKGGKPMTM
jgi:hypothetical protein